MMGRKMKTHSMARRNGREWILATWVSKDQTRAPSWGWRPWTRVALISRWTMMYPPNRMPVREWRRRRRKWREPAREEWDLAGAAGRPTGGAEAVDTGVLSG